MRTTATLGSSSPKRRITNWERWVTDEEVTETAGEVRPCAWPWVQVADRPRDGDYEQVGGCVATNWERRVAAEEVTGTAGELRPCAWPWVEVRGSSPRRGLGAGWGEEGVTNWERRVTAEEVTETAGEVRPCAWPWVQMRGLSPRRGLGASWGRGLPAETAPETVIFPGEAWEHGRGEGDE